MNDFAVTMFASHLTLAVILFFLVNWIGSHAVDFGYASTTLFEQPNESIALNFFIRALSPSVFIILLSASTVSRGRPSLRLDIYRIAIYYYFVRVAVIFLLNRQRLISWPRFIGHASVGVAAAILVYHQLILPNRALIPNLDDAGNELWLAIFAFLYAVANKVPLPGGPGARRRNSFIEAHYKQSVRNFGTIIDRKIQDSLLRLIAYSILIYEDYARPPAVRTLEGWMFWKRQRTTGVMQVAGNSIFNDEESVEKGTDILIAAWNKHFDEEFVHSRVWSAIGEYNFDSDYITRVMEIMEILAMRVDPAFKTAYQSVYSE